MKTHPQTGSHTPKDTKEVLFSQAQNQLNTDVKPSLDNLNKVTKEEHKRMHEFYEV